MASSIITDYIGCGLAAARPATPNLATGAFGIYFATDTGAVTIWDGSSWQGLSGSGTLTGLTGDVTASGSGSVAATLAVPLTPGGRLTLTSNTPVMNADATAQGTVYYAPYVHARTPLYTGSVWAMRAFTQISLALNSTDNLSGSLYDIFVFDDSGTLTLGTGPAWSSSTSRGAGAGTTELELKDGIWTNKVSITLKAGGSTVGTPAANRATYLGTIYCTANGQTGMVFEPTPASGGTNNILGLYNAYNRIPVYSIVRDGAANWVVSNTSWAATNASNNNRCSFVDGLQQSQIRGTYKQYFSITTLGKNVRNGMSLDSTTATPKTSGRNTNVAANSQGDMIAVDRWGPQLGFHFIQMQQLSEDASNSTQFGGGAAPTLNSMVLELMM